MKSWRKAREKINYLLSIGLVTGGILMSIPFLTTSCSRDKPNPLPPITNGYNWDGTNWDGWVSGGLDLIDLGNHQVGIQGNNGYTATDLVIPNEVVKGRTIYKITSIGASAFEDCTGLAGSLIIGNNVQSIGDRAFNGCTNLTTSLILPNSVVSIGQYAFAACLYLESITLSNSLKSNLGDGAFRYEFSLTNIIASYNTNPTWIGVDIFADAHSSGSVTNNDVGYTSQQFLNYLISQGYCLAWSVTT